MTYTRSVLREKAMIILYQININEDRKMAYNIEEIINSNLEVENGFVNELVHGVMDNQETLDDLANKYMKDWDINRIDKTGKAILEIALYELEFTETPEIVVINEAVELAKKYSDDAVRKIINAVLDKVIKEK